MPPQDEAFAFERRQGDVRIPAIEREVARELSGCSRTRDLHAPANQFPDRVFPRPGPRALPLRNRDRRREGGTMEHRLDERHAFGCDPETSGRLAGVGLTHRRPARGDKGLEERLPLRIRRPGIRHQERVVQFVRDRHLRLGFLTNALDRGAVERAQLVRRLHVE